MTLEASLFNKSDPKWLKYFFKNKNIREMIKFKENIFVNHRSKPKRVESSFYTLENEKYNRATILKSTHEAALNIFDGFKPECHFGTHILCLECVYKCSSFAYSISHQASHGALIEIGK